ncbi:MAG: hypothetical protein FWE03_06200 [Firmicutes bacterium]|nr:hypothetical protein [Bacillota bacterium]
MQINNAIQACADTGGGKVVLREGIYRCNERIVVQTDNITICGMGNGTVIMPNGLSTIRSGRFNVQASNVIIRDLRMNFGQASISDTSSCGIIFTPIEDKVFQNIYIENVTIFHNSHCIVFWRINSLTECGYKDVVFSNCYLETSATNAVRFWGNVVTNVVESKQFTDNISFVGCVMKGATSNIPFSQPLVEPSLVGTNIALLNNRFYTTSETPGIMGRSPFTRFIWMGNTENDVELWSLTSGLWERQIDIFENIDDIDVLQSEMRRYSNGDLEYMTRLTIPATANQWILTPRFTLPVPFLLNPFGISQVTQDAAIGANDVKTHLVSLTRTGFAVRLFRSTTAATIVTVILKGRWRT